LAPEPTITSPTNAVAFQFTPTNTPSPTSQPNSPTTLTDPNAITWSYTATSDPPSSQTTDPIPSESELNREGLSHSAVGGIAGGTIGFFAIIGLLWRAFVYLRSRPRHNAAGNKQLEVLGAPEFEPESPPEKRHIIFTASTADLEIAGGRLKYPNEGILYSGRLNVNNDD
jgi:hypothetical protein